MINAISRLHYDTEEIESIKDIRIDQSKKKVFSSIRFFPSYYFWAVITDCGDRPTYFFLRSQSEVIGQFFFDIFLFFNSSRSLFFFDRDRDRDITHRGSVVIYSV